MPPLELPSASEWGERWVSGAQGAGSRFAENAQAAASDWFDRAGSQQAQDNYETQMQDPNVLARRGENINQQAQNKYSTIIGAVGSTRYNSGVENSRDFAEAAISDLFQAAEGVNLPERGTPLSQPNQQRARLVQEAFSEAGESV